MSLKNILILLLSLLAKITCKNVLISHWKVLTLNPVKNMRPPGTTRPYPSESKSLNSTLTLFFFLDRYLVFFLSWTKREGIAENWVFPNLFFRMTTIWGNAYCGKSQDSFFPPARLINLIYKLIQFHNRWIITLIRIKDLSSYAVFAKWAISGLLMFFFKVK